MFQGGVVHYGRPETFAVARIQDFAAVGRASGLRCRPPNMTGRVTMKDVAAALGVSTATVSRALKNDLAISVATRNAVAEMAQRLQYRPSAAARRLRTKSTSLIGVVVQSVGDGYIGDVVLGIQSRARSLGYQPLFFAAEGREDLESEALEVFLSEQVTELIAVSPTGSPRLLRRAVEEGMHVAVINGDTEVPGGSFRGRGRRSHREAYSAVRMRHASDAMCHISFDDMAAGMLATNHLRRSRPHAALSTCAAPMCVRPCSGWWASGRR